jgi:hypothetical protein
LAYLESGFAGHHHIKQSQIDCPVANCVECLIAVFGTDDLITFSDEDVGEQLAIHIVVVGDKNGSFA